MGCHTCSAKRVDKTIEEAREYWINNQKKLISYLKDDLLELDNNHTSLYNMTRVELINGINVFERQLNMVEKGLCDVAVMNRQESGTNYISGKGFFIDVDEYHDVFRIGECPNTELFSKDECLLFIEKNIDKIIMYPNTYKKIYEFWDKHPDGYMYFS